jgi:hypothetical protein
LIHAVVEHRAQRPTDRGEGTSSGPSWRIFAPPTQSRSVAPWATFEGHQVFESTALAAIASAPEGAGLVFSSCVDPVSIDGGEDAQVLPSWMGPAAARRSELKERLEALAAAGRPRGIHVHLLAERDGLVSDVPSILSLGRELAGTGVGLIVEPMALLAPSMLARIPEHLGRLYSVATYLETVSAIIVSDAVLLDTDATAPTQVGSGAAGELQHEIVNAALQTAWKGTWVLDGSWPSTWTVG